MSIPDVCSICTFKNKKQTDETYCFKIVVTGESKHKNNNWLVHYSVIAIYDYQR